jgi:hypothetical protein
VTQVFVLAAPGRDVAHERLRASLRESDVGENYVWCENPPGVDKVEHWSSTFARMAESDHEMVILLEDDALVNRHLISNVETWRWPRDEKFGAGWLYSPGAYKAGTDCWYTGAQPLWYGTVGVLYWKRDVIAIHKAACAWMHSQKSEAWDWAVAWAVHHHGKKIRQHGPPLVEHQLDVPSTLGHNAQHCWANATTRGTFRGEWRRELRP